MSEAIKLMLTGMGTVFVILILVVVLGNLIVIVTNKLSVEQLLVPKRNQISGNEISSQKLAAIIATVEAITGGKGKVSSIKKSNQ